MENSSTARSAFVNQVITPGQTWGEKNNEVYDKWGADYNKHMVDYSFHGPELASQGIIKHTSGNKDVYILDVAAGTGLVAEELKKADFTNIDALDPSQGMLQVARDKNLYKQYLELFFTDNMECIETNTYDVLVAVGAMAEGHLKLNTFPEMIRCVKPGGLVLLTISEHHLNNDDEYKDMLEPYVKRLQAEGQWQQVEKVYDQEYNCNYAGFLFVFKITKAN